MFTRSQFDTFLAGLPHPPNAFQLKVLDSIAFGEGNKVVSALAGSGKTTLLVQTAHLFKAMGITSVGYLAFNVSIRDELNARLPHPYRAVNSHSLGMQVLKALKPTTKVNTGKWNGIAKTLMSQIGVEPHMQYVAGRVFQSLCSKVMLNMANPDDLEEIAVIAEQYSLDNVTGAMMMVVKDAIDMAKDIWEKTGEINFDEMLYWPVVMNLEPPKHDFFLVDECQDLNILQQELAFRSVKPGGRMIFVGDERQAIYAFAGADAFSFQRIITNTKAEVLPLNVCYRCPTSHLDLARKLVPAIEARPDAIKGEIEYISDTKVPTIAKPGSLVMCRLTAPLVSLYFKFIQNKVRAKVMGKDIGAQLISVMEKVEKFEGFRYEKAIAFLEKYRDQQIMNLMQREGMEQQIENVRDQVQTLIVCIENFDSAKSVKMLKDVLEDLFGDQDKENWKTMVTLCTVHRAKGLEADETFILRPDKMPLVWKDQKDSDYQQELNIFYVSLTRAKKKLYVCGELSALVKEAPAVDEKPVAVQPALLPIEPALPELAAPLTPSMPTPREPMPAINQQDIDAFTERMNGGFGKQIEAFQAAAPKPVEITPVLVSPAPKEHSTFPASKQRTAYSKGVMDALEAMSTGELMQMQSVLEAILKEREKVIA